MAREVQMKKPKIEYTSVALAGDNWRKLLEDGITACNEHGFEFGVQIHNTATQSQIEEMVELGVELSFHAPILSEYQINLAGEDPGKSLEAIAKTAGLMRKYNVKKAVFHGFNMSDLAIPSFGRGRDYTVAFASVLRKELTLPDSIICNDFFKTDEYKIRNARVCERLAAIRTEYADLSFLLENDFPAFGAGSIFAEHIVKMKNPICLDSSHLWASSFIFDRDFHHEAEYFLKSGLVEMVHLHASTYNSEIPKAKWYDGHLPLNTENRMDLPRFINLCRKYSALNFVLEINGLSRCDIDYLGYYLKSDFSSS